MADTMTLEQENPMDFNRMWTDFALGHCREESKMLQTLKDWTLWIVGWLNWRTK